MIEEKQKEQEKYVIKEKVRCPMCGSIRNEREGEVDNYLFISCADCQFVFCPQITPDYLSRLYAEGYHGPQDGAPSAGWDDNPEFLDPALRLLSKDQYLMILDFGTGQSLIPGKLRKQGHKVVAVDVVPPLEPHPDRLTGDIFELELEKNHFDLVFSFQVFEHLPRPRPVLEELLACTAEGGLLLIHTDMETPERDQENFGDWWYVAPPDHCAFFRLKTFKVFLEDLPHELVFEDEKRVVIRKRT